MTRLSRTELEGIGQRFVTEYNQKCLTPEIKRALERLAVADANAPSFIVALPPTDIARAQRDKCSLEAATVLG